MARPNFLTVEEAGRVLRIGRTAAYEGVKKFRATGGIDGIPVVAVGGSLRVPVPRLEEWAGGPLDLSVLERDGTRADADDNVPSASSHPRGNRGPRSRKPGPSLPFTD